MANKDPKHIVENQIINLEIKNISDDKEVQQIQQNLIYFYKSRLANELDKTLTQICPPDVDIEINDLVVDLGDITFFSPANLEQQLVRKFKDAIKKAVQTKIKKMQLQHSSKSGRKQKFSKIAIIDFFLQNGFLPVWASNANGSVQDIFSELIKKKPKVLAQRILNIGKKKQVQERLYQQISIQNLEYLLQVLYGNKQKIVLQKLSLLHKKLKQKSKKQSLVLLLTIS